MTNEKRYEAVCKMIYEYARIDGEGLAEKVISAPHNFVNNPYTPFYSNAAALLIECLEGMDKKQTPARVTAALKRILRSVPECNANEIGGVISGSDTYYVLDGHRMVRLHADVAALPHLVSENAYKPADLDKIMRNVKALATAEEFTLPTIPELKAYIAKNKATNGKDCRPIYRLGNMYVNPSYLLDALEALPGCKMYIPQRNNVPIYIEAATGDGILLPLHSA